VSVLDRAAMFLTDLQAETALLVGDSFLMCFGGLAKASADRGERLFRITPKRRYLKYQSAPSTRHGQTSTGQSSRDYHLAAWANNGRAVVHLARCHKFQCGMLGRIRRGSRLNPRCMSCWHDESFVGLLCRMTRQGHPRSVGSATIVRWQLMVGARWGFLD